MTPKEKADELTQKFRYDGIAGIDLSAQCTEKEVIFYAKRCALIAVNEMLSLFEVLHKPEYTSFITDKINGCATCDGYEYQHFLEDVKTELEKPNQ